jgi:ferredoxin
MALISTLLPSEPRCEIALIYANRSLDQVIFAAALQALEAEHAGRLRVHHTFEQPPSLARLLDDEALATDPEAEFMICGPTPMMTIARELLAERGIPDTQIHVENFLAPRLDAAATDKLRGPQAITIAIAGREVGLTVQPGQSILEAGLAAGLSMPYSCAMGGCAACKVVLERGAVIMREPNCLIASERASGYVLACVANPTEPCRVRVADPVET